MVAVGEERYRIVTVIRNWRNGERKDGDGEMHDIPIRRLALSIVQISEHSQSLKRRLFMTK